MDTLTSIKVFRQVVESGHFVAAAEHLNLSTANVSKHVMSLEKRLGVRLLNRSSRALSLTEPGRVYFERSKTIVDEMETAELELGSLNTTPRGTLRISCPSWFATQQIADTLALYRRTYPDVIVDISFEDRIVDLVQEGYDLALRVIRYPESLPADQVARPVRQMVFHVGASREYIKRNGAPKSLQDLASHDMVAVGNLSSWVFENAAGKREVPARTVIRFRSMAGVAHAVAAGMGLARLPAHFFKDPQFKDILTPVLTDHPVWQTTLYIVYASRKFIPLKIRTFADLLLLLEVARRKETQQRRRAPLEVGVSATNESSRSRSRSSLALMASVV
jgi:DNA-binding transcriptional LysR family regulator